MVSRSAVQVATGVPARVDVHDDRRQLGLSVKEAVPDLLRKPMTLTGRKILVDHDAHIGFQTVAEPSHAQVVDLLHALDRGRLADELLHHRRVGRVHQAMPHLHGRLFQDEQNGDRDAESDHRIGERKAGQHTDCAEQDRQRGEAVGSGVMAIGDQCC